MRFRCVCLLELACFACFSELLSCFDNVVAGFCSSVWNGTRESALLCCCGLEQLCGALSTDAGTATGAVAEV